MIGTIAVPAVSGARPARRVWAASVAATIPASPNIATLPKRVPVARTACPRRRNAAVGPAAADLVTFAAVPAPTRIAIAASSDANGVSSLGTPMNTDS